MAKKKQAAPPSIVNRIVAYGTKPADQFQANPMNWRTHPEAQRTALAGILESVGWAAPVIENVRTGHLIDGHERVWQALQAGVEVPYVQVDVSENEERTLLTTLDPIGALADTDREKLAALMADVRSDDARVQELIAGIAKTEKIQTLTESGRVRVPLRNAEGLEDPAAARFVKYANVIVQFSGGRDSTCALLWVKANLPAARVVAMYADLGAELPGYILHVLKVLKEVGCESLIVRTRTSIIEGFLEKGWPCWRGPWCQQMMYAEMAAVVRERFSPEDTIMITGSRGAQKKATSKTQADTPFESSPEYAAYRPIFDWSDEAVQNALERSGVPLWSGYALGLKRTCCWCCPGQRPSTYAALRAAYPGVWRAFLELEKTMGGPGRHLWQGAQKGLLSLESAADYGEKSRV